MSIVDFNGGGFNPGQALQAIGRQVYRMARTRSGRVYRRQAVARGQRQRRAGRVAQNRRRNRRQTSGHAASTYHDQRFIYARKPMPRRMRKRWKRFRNKVLAVSEKDLGSRTVVFNRTYNWSNNVADTSGLANQALYPYNSGGGSPFSDLGDIIALENQGNPTVVAGDRISATTKFIFKSAVMDLTITNGSMISELVDMEATYVANSRAILELDIYECVCSKPLFDNTAAVGDLISAFAAGANDTANIGGAGTGIAWTATAGASPNFTANCVRGATPWDMPAALSQFGVKVMKKRKFFVPNQQTITYQVRDPKRRVASYERLREKTGTNLPGWTRWLYITYKMVPGIPLGDEAVVGNGIEQIHIGCTRKYFYKIEGFNEDRDRFLIG